jgi:hypothetical protein
MISLPRQTKWVMLAVGLGSRKPVRSHHHHFPIRRCSYNGTETSTRKQKIDRKEERKNKHHVDTLLRGGEKRASLDLCCFALIVCNLFGFRSGLVLEGPLSEVNIRCLMELVGAEAKLYVLC